eukprot:TRINITY_DN113486_c0_g1_i1.p1 TRINITY_DN113486_c0_g1~~TRINITY_DN113486_c0_g1_i1.p1  ORF type:complete len:901 (-),score=183.87 TRINITY_DN113486_c0_g1_i1:352-3054(-)
MADADSSKMSGARNGYAREEDVELAKSNGIQAKSNGGVKAAAADTKVSQAALPTVCLLGATGSGKSATGNTLLGSRGEVGADTVFEMGSRMSSVTSATSFHTGLWRGTGHTVRVVDTPGLGDSEGRDSEHIAAMTEILKNEVAYVHVFLLVFNSQEPRMSDHLKDMLSVFKEVFGDGFIRHLVIAFTRWEFDRKATKRRTKTGDSMEKKTAMMNEELRKVLGHAYDCPSIFLDNSLNMCSNEDLEDLLEDELEPVLNLFQEQLDTALGYVLGLPPFRCEDVQAVLAKKDALRARLKERVQLSLQLSEVVDMSRLGRSLVTSGQDVIHCGWLRWRRRRWLWAVLRRQYLRFYVDDKCLEAAGPERLDLTGCVCGIGPVRLSNFVHFTIYRPVLNPLQAAQNNGGESSEMLHEIFAVRGDEERRRWVLLVQEATQISESCHRIQKFHDALHLARSEDEYLRSIDLVDNETMVIPVDWVQQCNEVPKAPGPTLEQANKDLRRDAVSVDGRLFDQPDCEHLASEIAALLLEGLRHNTRSSGQADEEMADAKAVVLARDVLLNCSRTQGGGDTLDALMRFFANDDLVHCAPDNRIAPEPISVRILHESTIADSASTLRGSIQIGSSGVPEFQHDEYAVKLNLERVRQMKLNGEQQLHVVAVGKSVWVKDDEMPQCMRCGVQFQAWLRRHHCRACGALICFYCSRHFVPLAVASAPSSASLVGTDSEPSPSTAQSGRSVAADTMAKVERVRVCFLCYQKCVIEDLNNRKEAALREAEENERQPVAEDGADGDQALPRNNSEATASGSSSRSGSFKLEDNHSDPSDEATKEQPAGEKEIWPLVTIEMASGYKVCTMNPVTNDSVLFWLDCRFVKVVRWNGIADEGKIFISVRRRPKQVAESPSGSVS